VSSPETWVTERRGWKGGLDMGRLFRASGAPQETGHRNEAVTAVAGPAAIADRVRALRRRSNAQRRSEANGIDFASLQSETGV